jgi:hypothetical protein
MTSEPETNEGRTPPTIELKATEVHDPAAATDAGTAPGDASTPPSSGAAETSPPPGGSSRRLASHALSATIGAVVTAAVVVGLWFAGIIPRHAATAPASVSPAATAPTPGIGPDLSARLDKIEHTIQAQPDRQAQTNRMAAVEAQTKSLGDSLAALGRRVDDIAGTSASASKQAAAAQSAAQAAKAASDTASQANQAAVHKSDLDALANRVAALESTVKGLADATSHPASGDDPAARLNIAAQALHAAIARGAPYQAELAAVQALGAQHNATASLEPFAASGVPSAAALADEFGRLVPALRRATETSSGATTILGRLEANARHLIRVTPVDAPAGNAPAAVVARIEADASHADIAAALNDVAALPDSAKPLVATWVEKAKARQAALEASRQITADALAALSKPASQSQ